MKAWSAPDVPELPGSGQIPQIYDTASRRRRPSAESGNPAASARLYVCGITPYDATHIGHAATYVAFDLLVRAWLDAGLDVCYVQNVTDIDDPLLERAAQTGEDWMALAERETELFRDDMTALRAVAPTHFVGAVESIPLIVELIERLRDRGATYEVDGDLYFPVSADPSFGQLSRLDRPTMLELFGERGGDPDRPGKADPLDSLLWRRERPDEPSWETALGRGRPGWHVECAAIALHHLGTGFDVQGGGTDLVFPHHEMSASAGRVATERTPFARAYLHQGMIGLDGSKMSKSLGNLVFVSRLREQGADPMAVRLALLARHYREEWDWTPEGLGAAEGRVERWRSAVGQRTGPDGAALLADVRAALADDLDAPAAVAAVDRWAGAALNGQGSDADAPALVRRTVDALLGIAL